MQQFYGVTYNALSNPILQDILEKPEEKVDAQYSKKSVEDKIAEVKM